MNRKELNKLLFWSGLFFPAIRTEMVDHYLCMYDEMTDRGSSPEEAKKMVYQSIDKNNLKSLNREYLFINHKHSIYMGSLIFALSSFFMLFNQQSSGLFDPPSISPVAKGEIVAAFGMRVHPVSKMEKMHYGIDIKAPMGAEVVAPEDAIVQEVGYSTKKGNYIVLKHDDIYETKFYHLQTIKVEEGQKVEKGKQIATVGNTGLSTKPHLHYEVLKNGKRVNPATYL